MDEIKSYRERLLRSAWLIGERTGNHYGQLTAFRKLFIQENRKKGGWKRGEIFELFMTRSKWEFKEEWGDLGYYLSQTCLWWVYALITPKGIINNACVKFEVRAKWN